MTALPLAFPARPVQWLNTLRSRLPRLPRGPRAGPIAPPENLAHPPSARAVRHMRYAQASWW
jgi:hypothetical protein